MLATRIRQKDGVFYFASYPAKEVLERVRFISRFYGEGEEIVPQSLPQHDEIAQFIARIERTDEAFQRNRYVELTGQQAVRAATMFADITNRIKTVEGLP